MIKPYTFIVRLDVAPLWMADGFCMTDADALEMLAKMLPHACQDTELAAQVLVAPDVGRISKEQGFGVYTSERQQHDHHDQLRERSPVAYDEKDGIVPVLTRLQGMFERQGLPGFAGDLGAIIDKLTGVDAISDIEWQEAE